MLCFRKLSVTKSLWIRGECHYFSMKVCCLAVAKNFVGEPFSAVFQKFVGNKKLWIRGEYQYFSKKVCCLTVLRNFIGEPFRVSLYWASKIFMLKRGMLQFSVEISLSRSTEKLGRLILLCCVSENCRQR